MIPDQLEQQIYQCLDGKMSDAEKQALFLELKNNPEAMKLYCLSASLDANLNRIAHGQLSLNTASESFADLASKSQKRKSFKIAVLAAAAVVVIGLITMQLFMVKEQPPTITFAASPGTQFELSHSTTKDAPKGMTLEKGSRLQLSQGTVELTFASGVRSIIMAPADITLHKDDTLFMNRGTAWFQVPQQATGFTVKTKDLDIIDLGTEFGVLAKTDDHDEVHVFKGKVQVTAQGLRKESSILIANEARKNDPVGRLDTIVASPSSFLTTLPKSLPYLHWSFDQDAGFQVAGTHPDAANISVRKYGSPQFSPGKKGNALSLNGKKQHLITDWSGFPGDRPRTVSFWIKLPKTGSNNLEGSCIIGWGDNDGVNTKWKIMVLKNPKNQHTYLRLSWGAIWINGNTHLADEKWHHIIVTSPGNTNKKSLPTAEIYIDGKKEHTQYQSHTTGLQSQGMNTAIHTRNSTPLVIGRSIIKDFDSRPYLRGLVDELYIFDGHMSEHEANTLLKR